MIFSYCFYVISLISLLVFGNCIIHLFIITSTNYIFICIPIYAHLLLYHNCQFEDLSSDTNMLKRKSVIQTDRKKKISLPAALFNRSPLKNVENSSMISNTSFVNGNDPVCQNHENKKGKYQVVSEEMDQQEQIYYCEKCAILLASKGFEVRKIQSNDPKPVEKKKINPRQLELNNFVKAIQEKSKLLKQNKKQAAQQLSQIEQQFEDKVRKIQQFFDELYTTLEKHKNNQIHQQSLQKKQAEQELTTYLGYMAQKIELLETMNEDISSSHESIVNETPEADYQLVMTHYQSNLAEIKADPVSTTFGELSLPAIDSLQAVLAQIFQNSTTNRRSGTYFSFDSTKKGAHQ